MNMKDDLDLLKKQFEVNDERLKKLEKHKKSIGPELKKSQIQKRLREAFRNPETFRS